MICGNCPRARGGTLIARIELPLQLVAPGTEDVGPRLDRELVTPDRLQLDQ